MKFLLIAATNHKNSINKKLLYFTKGIVSELIPNSEVNTIDLVDYELPLYRQDREQENGIPEKAKRFYQMIGEADAVVIAFAEHNGSYTAVYKNLFDWTSRLNQKVYQDKPTILMAATPGPRGGAGVLGAAEMAGPFFGMDIKGKVSVGKFKDNYDLVTNEIINREIVDQIRSTVVALKKEFEND
ncbi:NADPH-dependent FMN reductase [Pseudobacteriovorax antillogorgiicola]|uniref:NAD(P)H-dependent FMN reductase n=1 Tax=Pseudobacteriovorax antillogorgiicola TaxID=1513793 RepID=A0A1Y6C7Y5_9BACT|nr:NAD(P)H-dependent oxidoreductase [Pseudobacteriovorax antillogorgiicola]TCS49342.1 NAD(P)H-dependent FMN reductase [Pseudobacteriovorax antillogorgiicola]SMF47707.1 NAD(P)H-dependent FMN reductase [Pseudobacteriovorax antillogorgiicola]